MPYNNISNPSTHPPNPTITSHTTCWNFSLEQFFKTWDFCLFPDISNSLTLPYSDRGPEVGGEENGGGQTSSPGEVLHTVGKHKQETCSLRGMQITKHINLWVRYFVWRKLALFCSLNFIGIKKNEWLFGFLSPMDEGRPLLWAQAIISLSKYFLHTNIFS